MKIFIGILMWLCCVSTIFADTEIQAVYPYRLDKQDMHTVTAGSTTPLYIDIKSFNNDYEKEADIRIMLPEGFSAVGNEDWKISRDGRTASARWTLPSHFGHSFGLLYVKAEDSAAEGEKHIAVEVEEDGRIWEKSIDFIYRNTGEKTADSGKEADSQSFGWYIQNITLPVDESGKMDDRTADGVLYIRNVSMESFRNYMIGDGATNWAVVFEHPAAYLLLDMRNPQRDIRLLNFRAELINKKTGKTVPGLCTAAKTGEPESPGWSNSPEMNQAVAAMLSLDGSTMQTFILPLYVDYFNVMEGSYILRVTVSDHMQKKVQEIPIVIEQRHNAGILAAGISIFCLLAAAAGIPGLKKCIIRTGAQGAVTIALFAAVAFGGVSVPATMFGELMHVFLGPFSVLLTGLFSGVFQYLLLITLVMLYRRPGVAALMFLIKFMLSCILFGHFTPLGLLSCCVYMAVVESVLRISGFYAEKEITAKHMLFISLGIGAADAGITWINLEQMMFFYRLYYANWYIGLCMLINGFLYSGIGSWIGYGLGLKLQQVTGE